MAHCVFLCLFVIDTVINTITYKPAFKHNISKQYGPAYKCINSIFTNINFNYKSFHCRILTIYVKHKLRIVNNEQ